MSIVAITDSDLGDGSIEREILSDHEVRVGSSRDADDIVALAAGADGLLVQWAPITSPLLDRLPGLKAIVRYGIGLDNIDQSATAARGIRVENVPDYCIDEVAAHALALIVARARRLFSYAAEASDGHWSVADVPPPKIPGDDPVGVVGVGRIGRTVAEQAAALGHPVLGWDPFAPSWPDGVERMETLGHLAARVNHLSLHIPLLPETTGIVGTSVLEALGAEGHLVNTSRGGLINETELLSALDRGALGYASLDVLATEPPSGTSALLVAHPKTLVTPHAAYCSDSSRYRLQVRAAEILEGLLGGADQ